ncbi:MAG: histidine triad nucleotide-binding protein [Bacteriovoracia bacterium]
MGNEQATDNNCIFCKIIRGEIPSQKLLDDEHFIAFRDIQPQAKTHLLVVPKRHVASVADAFAPGVPGGRDLMGQLYERAAALAQAQGLWPGGYRCVINTGAHGGQTVFHLHLHVLGGEPLTGKFA